MRNFAFNRDILLRFICLIVSFIICSYLNIFLELDTYKEIRFEKEKIHGKKGTSVKMIHEVEKKKEINPFIEKKESKVSSVKSKIDNNTLNTKNAEFSIKRPEDIPSDSRGPVEVFATTKDNTLKIENLTVTDPVTNVVKNDALTPPEEKPPLPGENAVDQSIYDDKPGTSVVVFGVYVNEDGVVVDTTIITPSKYGLADLTVALSMKNQKWTNIVPPLLPGEVRKLEIRYDYTDFFEGDPIQGIKKSNQTKEP